MKIEIDKKHISEAEQIFIKGNNFNPERINFIKNLETCDLLAVPGSGKTTALMAKLYCLSKQLPFKDGSGILVLAHTNATVNEIENKLKKHCPNLFEYPNFIGTIQSFINKYLVAPYYSQKTNSKFRIIDDLEYKSHFDYYLNNVRDSVAYFKNRNPDLFYKSRFNINDIGDLYICSENQNSEIQISCPKKWEKENTKADKINGVLAFIKDKKTDLFQKGVLHYDDCYFYAKRYIFNNSLITEILQHRFKFVFIDEMQDLEKYQIEIIDKIFLNENSKTVLQRIGDPNQSIYDRVKDECDWKPRNTTYLNDSNRLTNKNAELVNCFTLDSDGEKFKVVGKRKLKAGEQEILPHLILFKSETKGHLKDKFEAIIKTHNLDKIENEKQIFKIIGWTGERTNEGDGNLSLNTIFGYNKASKSRKEDFDTLSKYIQLFDKEKQTLEAVRKSILNALIAVLRLEDIKIQKKIRGKETERYYTKSDLIEFVKNHKHENEYLVEYENFKSKLYSWCFDLISLNDYQKVFISIKTFIENEFKEWFDLELNSRTKIFISEFKKEVATIDKAIINTGINIEVGTVHSAKGQTHCATMYVETAYKTPVYETLKLKEPSKNTTAKKKELKTIPLFMQTHSCETPSGKEALKIMYVGFSRPTHLLCFAVLEENVKGDIEKFRSAGWVINDDLIKIK